MVNKDKLKINRNEAMRYLQYKGQYVDNNFIDKVDNIISETIEKSCPRYVYSRFEIENIKDSIFLKGTDVELTGNDIKRLLRGCRECYIMAVTLGVNIDREIRKKEFTELTNSLIMDSCATSLVESLCDDIQSEIMNIIKPEGYEITMRYSPGYGDLSIYKNREILNVIEADRKIGLMVNGSGIMIPRKSVSAIIGIYNPNEVDNTGIKKRMCSECSNFSTCVYRRESGGFGCGN